ncbi:hypothetical protein [Nostoc parmelioides]|uniref:Uncharacterized protein n=1 Tax=Nostoc parmelioides FACHB-3921 TaxID=2692909 RepID=A0ABR8BP28_9NOSO|nr:hypothetical protein [Nostoc parmelioides]MBD2255723.1 hypothetical protein [Nostoc parmelioides FACHB-3921]
MKTVLANSTNSQVSTQTSQLVPSSSSVIEQPSAWMREGNSATEIILAAAILTSVLMAGVAGVITAMTGLIKTVAPEAVNQTSRKTK